MKKTIEIRIRKEAEKLLKVNGAATIEQLIKICKSFANEEEVFAAVVGTKYSTL